jgi:rubrerythrin
VLLRISQNLPLSSASSFPSAATDAKEEKVKAFYQYLADWEKQHFDALRNLYTSVRQDFFSAGSFAPF